MIVLPNCILKNVQGYFSRIQDEDGKNDISIYHTKDLSDKEIEAISRIVFGDSEKPELTRKIAVHQALVKASHSRSKDRDPIASDYVVMYYSRYMHDSGQMSFVLTIGDNPEYFNLPRGRAEFPNMEYMVYGAWKCSSKEVDGWYIYTLAGLCKTRFIILACKTELLPDEIYMVIEGYLQSVASKRSDGDANTTDVSIDGANINDATASDVTANDVNAAIAEIAQVSVRDDMINLPRVESVNNGSALLEIIASNNRNFILAGI